MIQEALQSYFILSKIKTTKWENRSYISQLLLMLKLMKKTRLSAAEGQLYFFLRTKYDQEFLLLLKENDPLQYRVFLEEQERMHHQEDIETTNKQNNIKTLIKNEIDEYHQWLSIQQSA
jgi:hypothetical protein